MKDLKTVEVDPKVHVYTTQELFGKEKQLVIKHGDQAYRLLITKAGKLILNK